MIFALRTIPFVVFIKLLRLWEFFQAVAKSDGTTALFCLLSSILIILHKTFRSLEMLKVLWGELQIPDNLKDQIALTSLVGVEVSVKTNIGVDTYLAH